MYRNENDTKLSPPNLPGLMEQWNDIFSLDFSQEELSYAHYGTAQFRLSQVIV